MYMIRDWYHWAWWSWLHHLCFSFLWIEEDCGVGKRSCTWMSKPDKVRVTPPCICLAERHLYVLQCTLIIESYISFLPPIPVVSNGPVFSFWRLSFFRCLTQIRHVSIHTLSCHFGSSSSHSSALYCAGLARCYHMEINETERGK